MKTRKFRIVIAPAIVFVAGILLLSPCHRAVWAAVLPAVWITILVIAAVFEKPEDEAAALEKVPDLKAQPLDKEYWKVLYQSTIQMHIDTDRGMFQLITVFVGASVLVLGWVVGRPGPAAQGVLVVGPIAVVLVGMATLLKHRLRHYNKLREIYLRKIEEQLEKGVGLHSFLCKAAKSPSGLRISFHETIDMYYFIYLVVWVAVYACKS